MIDEIRKIYDGTLLKMTKDRVGNPEYQIFIPHSERRNVWAIISPAQAGKLIWEMTSEQNLEGPDSQI